MTNDSEQSPARRPAVAKARRTYRDAALRQGRGFTPDKQAEYLALVASDVSRTQAAKLVGVQWSTVVAHRKKDPAFAEAELEAEEQKSENVESVLYQLALEGNIRAIEMWLFGRSGQRWKREKEKRIIHEGTVTHELEAGQTMQRIAELQATLSERAALRSGELAPPVIDVEAVEE